MKNMLTYMILLNSINLMYLNNPMSMGLLIITQTTIISVKMMTITKNSWFSYVIFITMIGGMMIMFIYMSSIASNEKFKFSKLMLMNLLNLMLMTLMINMKNHQPTNINYLLINIEEMPLMKIYLNEQEKSIMKFLSQKKMNILIIITMILLIILMFMTWINKSFKGPLKKTYE